LRIGELLDLRWRDVDLSAGVIHGRGGKTDAATREIDMLPVLRDELLALKAKARRTAPSDLVFGTSTGARQSESNIRTRVLAPSVRLANERLELAGEVPMPRLHPHALRHTYASVLAALGEDPRSVMAQIGHTTPTFTFTAYAHAMRRDEAWREALRRLVGLSDQAVRAAHWAAVWFRWKSQPYRGVAGDKKPCE
jgi:integrase